MDGLRRRVDQSRDPEESAQQRDEWSSQTRQWQPRPPCNEQENPQEGLISSEMVRVTFSALPRTVANSNLHSRHQSETTTLTPGQMFHGIISITHTTVATRPRALTGQPTKLGTALAPSSFTVCQLARSVSSTVKLIAAVPLRRCNTALLPRT